MDCGRKKDRTFGCGWVSTWTYRQVKDVNDRLNLRDGINIAPG